VANVLAGVFTLGIAVGSLACARLSGRMVEIAWCRSARSG